MIIPRHYCVAGRQLSKIDEICPPAIQNQISLISVQVPSLVKIHWHLHMLPSRNENMGVSRTGNSVKIWQNLPISNPKPDLHSINAHTVWWKSIDVYSSYHPETKYRWTDGWTDIRLMDGHTYRTDIVRLSLWSFFDLFNPTTPIF